MRGYCRFKPLLLYIFLLSLSFYVFCSGFSGLKLFFGARTTGLGENLCGLSEEVENIYHNPAGLVGINPFEFKIMYSNWVADINRSDLILAKSFKNKSVVAFSFNYMWTRLESEYNSSDYFSLIHTIAYARKLNKIYFGLGTTIVYESFSLEEGYNLAGGLDLGVLIRKQRAALGFSVKQIGKSFVYMGEDSEILPFNLNCGVSYIMPNNFVVVGNIKYNLDGLISFHTGLEVPLYRGIKEEIAIRAGNVLKLPSLSDLPIISNFRLGFGFRKEGLKIDYCLVPLGENIGFFHYISLGFIFY
ncbi:MAG: hypothetical protein ABDH23_00580 [Endomicrobiia bacterium]